MATRSLACLPCFVAQLILLLPINHALYDLDMDAASAVINKQATTLAPLTLPPTITPSPAASTPSGPAAASATTTPTAASSTAALTTTTATTTATTTTTTATTTATIVTTTATTTASSTKDPMTTTTTITFYSFQFTQAPSTSTTTVTVLPIRAFNAADYLNHKRKPDDYGFAPGLYHMIRRAPVTARMPPQSSIITVLDVGSVVNVSRVQEYIEEHVDEQAVDSYRAYITLHDGWVTLVNLTAGYLMAELVGKAISTTANGASAGQPRKSRTQGTTTTTVTYTWTPLSQLSVEHFDASDYVKNERRPSDYGVLIGEYIMTRRESVTSKLQVDSGQVAVVKLDYVIDVLEVVPHFDTSYTGKPNAFRGRIRSPAGWVTLVNLTTGQRTCQYLPCNVAPEFLNYKDHGHGIIPVKYLVGFCGFMCCVFGVLGCNVTVIGLPMFARRLVTRHAYNAPGAIACDAFDAVEENEVTHHVYSAPGAIACDAFDAVDENEVAIHLVPNDAEGPRTVCISRPIHISLT